MSRITYTKVFLIKRFFEREELITKLTPDNLMINAFYCQDTIRIFLFWIWARFIQPRVTLSSDKKLNVKENIVKKC